MFRTGKLCGYGNEYLWNHGTDSSEEGSDEYQMEAVCQGNRQEGEDQDGEIDKDDFLSLI